MSTKILRNYVAKKLYEKGGTIANRKSVDFSTAAMAERLTEFGIDPRLINSESELIGALNIVKQMQDKAFDKQFGGMLKGSKFDKRAEVFDLEGKKIPNPEKNIMGGQAFETEDEIAKGLSDKEFRSEKTSFRLNIGKNSPEFNQDLAKRIINREIYTDLSDSQRKEFLKDLDFVLKNPRDGNANGGRIGYRIGGGPIKNPIKSFFEFLNKKNPVQAYRDYLKNIKDKTLKANETGKFTDLPIAEVGIPATTGAFINRAVKKRLQAENEKLKEKEPEKKASGGRIGFKKGMSKRQFLQLMAGLGITGAAAKSGLVSLGGKTAGKEAVKQVIKTPSVAGKPEWFDTLVNKVIREGDDVTKNFATKEREIVHKLDIDNLDDVKVTQDLDEGLIRVEYNSPNNMGEDTVELVFKKGRPEEEGMMPDEFYAVEKEPRAVGGPEDADLEFDGENLVKNVDDLQSDTSKLKQVATGKKQTMSEFVNSKKKKDKVKSINEDQVEQAEYLETKYGPYERYLSEDVDADFASGGIARMLGE
tara:strand:- start:2760 stop:4355 length:1596 start_codon:yes stop_codon:yes gene_type:complete